MGRATASWRGRWTSTVRARWVSRRETVGSNPVPSVAPFATVDLHLLAGDIGVRGLAASLRVTNLFDARL